MGCDIHCFAEQRRYNKDRTKSVWISIDSWEQDIYEDDLFDELDFPQNPWWPAGMDVSYKNSFYGGRDYELFNKLCGVRGSGRGAISRPRGIPKDVSLPVQMVIDRWEGDAHSHNWNTLAELLEHNMKEYMPETIEKLSKYLREGSQYWSAGPEDLRLVYFFDN